MLSSGTALARRPMSTAVPLRLRRKQLKAKAMPNELPDYPKTVLTELLGRIATQDAAALLTLYALAAPKLFGIALHILGRQEWAEEVLQEAFFNIWRFAPQYRCSVSGPLVWMSAIVRNRAFDYLRQQKSRGCTAFTEWDANLDEVLASDLAGPLEALSLSEEARLLSVMMKRLEVAQRRAVTLAYLCALTHCEVAEAMDVPVGTAKAWIRRGIQKLRSGFDDASARRVEREEY
jgi:RNA polymerase sigma-70 factor (ECF subfamily)